MSETTQSAIIWPAKFLPGTTENFVSNETIAKDITASQIWALLADTSKWSSYYANVDKITPPSAGSLLKQGDVFEFSTFGFPVLTSHVEESVEPDQERAGRLAWSASLDGSEEEAVSVYHAWLVEDLSGGRVRILTQESQSGKPAADLAGSRPNVMLLGHQDWLNGLVKAARGQAFDRDDTNLASVGKLAY